ncbi:hypothetical protein ANCCAN_08233 [Ancylostoma caninum]|uniref:Uncharacterized protein n=1 Tax=Ancylostoma caninum TaxID=29170 RepID=A0A368GMX9_ANCCA|nr:hypothetical protein ANCCAN_08233 [Ancylostoma caninum]
MIFFGNQQVRLAGKRSSLLCIRLFKAVTSILVRPTSTIITQHKAKQLSASSKLQPVRKSDSVYILSFLDDERGHYRDS